MTKMTNKRWPVGGVDRSGDVDRISIQNAVETPFWLAVWAAEPERSIDVRMSYSDLKILCNLIDARRAKVRRLPLKAYYVYFEEEYPEEAQVEERTVTDISAEGQAYIKEDNEWVDFRDPVNRMFWDKESAEAMLEALKKGERHGEV